MITSWEKGGLGVCIGASSGMDLRFWIFLLHLIDLIDILLLCLIIGRFLVKSPISYLMLILLNL